MRQASRFPSLFKPGKIGGLQIRNRIIMAPMGTNFAAEDGSVTERIRSYYEERAKGGVGLIIVGVGSVNHPRGSILPRQLGLSDDRFIPGLHSLTKAVHRHGAKIAIQLNHGGKLSRQDLAEGYPPVTPSPVSTLMTEMIEGMTKEEIRTLAVQYAKMPADKITRELTTDEIKHMVICFAESAGRAKAAGFDGVEIHAGHGYLIAEFLSRNTNKRQDMYGGGLENRARLLLEIVDAVKKKVGDDYPVLCRIDGREFNVEDGITIEESLGLARMLEEAGIAALHVSGYGGAGLGGFYDAPIVYPPGNLLPLAREIKKHVFLPVIAVGRISPEMAEEALRDEKADFIAMGRPLLADPKLPDKLASGEQNHIRPCIMCYCCVSQIFWGESIYCTVNSITGNEYQIAIDNAKVTKNIAVVGGGPSGIEAAIAAAKRGHKVTIYERENYIGGQFYIASLPPFKHDIGGYLKFCKHELDEAGVNVKLGTEANAANLADEKPDVVVIACGGRPLIPDIPGIRGNNVVTAHDVISGKATTGTNVLVAGGGLIGCEAADILSSSGKHVTIVEMLPNLASDMVIWLRLLLMQRLEQTKVTKLTSTQIIEFTEDGAIVEKDGQRELISGMDNIVLALGVEQANELHDTATDIAPEIFVIGDANSPGKARDAIYAGTRLGLKI